MAWVYLIIAIVCEVFGTSMLRLASQSTSWWPVVGIVGGYAAAFLSLYMMLPGVPVGIAYALWSGIGTAGIVAVGWLSFGQQLNAMTMLGIGLVICGVVAIQLGSPVH